MIEDFKNIKVIVAEDDAMVSEMTISILNELGFNVIGEAENGFVAVEMTKRLKPDVVLLDLDMPKMGGFEAAKQINKTCPTPIVVLTAFESVDFVKKASECGVGAYLIKPPQPKELERSLLISISRFNDLERVRKLNSELQQALEDVKMLSGLIPICSSCKNIRDDSGYWHKLETYISSHSDARFTHGICPSCMERFSQFSENELAEKNAFDKEET